MATVTTAVDINQPSHYAQNNANATDQTCELPELGREECGCTILNQVPNNAASASCMRKVELALCVIVYLFFI